MTRADPARVRHPTIELAGEPLEVVPGRAVWWPRARTIFVADTHFGKPDAFRQAGIPVPEGSARADLDRLATLIARHGAERLVVLGDLFHARLARPDRLHDLMAAWRDEHRSLDVLLVRGNHDRSAGDPPDKLRITCASEPVTLGPLTLLHDPAARPDSETPALAGHLHPAVTLDDPATGSRVRLPCYWLSDGLITLPAFGTFTGAKAVTPRRGDRVIAVVGGGAVHEITRFATPRGRGKRPA